MMMLYAQCTCIMYCMSHDMMMLYAQCTCIMYWYVPWYDALCTAHWYFAFTCAMVQCCCTHSIL